MKGYDRLSSSGRLMGIPHPLVEAFALPVRDARHDLAFCRGVAAQLVRNQHTKRSPLLLQKPAEQTFGSRLVGLSRDWGDRTASAMTNYGWKPHQKGRPSAKPAPIHGTPAGKGTVCYIDSVLIPLMSGHSRSQGPIDPHEPKRPPLETFRNVHRT
jgi:hypothetical protein